MIPCMGGSQHLTRFVGKAKATEMCFTGRITDVHEAERCGLVSHCKGASLEEALKVADVIAGMSFSSRSDV